MVKLTGPLLMPLGVLLEAAQLVKRFVLVFTMQVIAQAAQGQSYNLIMMQLLAAWLMNQVKPEPVN